MGECAGLRKKNDASSETGGPRRREIAEDREQESQGGDGTPSRMLYCFCVRSKWEKDSAEGVDERQCERDSHYRLLEICIFVGHTSLPR